MNKEYKILGLPAFAYILFLAAALRLYNLGAPSIYDDEAFSIWVAKFNIPSIITYMSTDAHPPLYFMLLHGWVNLFGDTELATRLLSVVFSLGTVILIYALCNDIFKDKKYGLFASLLFALSSFSIIDIDTDVKMYSMLMFLTILSVYLLCKLMNAGNAYTRSLRIWLWILYTIVLILLIYTHYFSFFVIAAELAYLFLFYKPVGAQYIVPLRIVLILLLAFLPWSKSFFHQLFVVHAGGADYRAFFLKGSLFHIANTFYRFFAGGIFKTPFWVTGILSAGIVFLILLGNTKILKYKNGAIVPVLFFGVFSASFAVSGIWFKKCIFATRFLSVIFPFFIILLTCAVLSLQKKILKYSLAAVLIVSFAAVNFLGYWKYVNDPRYWKQDFRSVAAYVGKNTDTRGVIILQPSYNILAFNYYYKGGLPKITIDRGLDANFLKRQIEQHDKIYYILTRPHIIDPERNVLKYLTRNYVFKDAISTDGSYWGKQDVIYIGIFENKK